MDENKNVSVTEPEDESVSSENELSIPEENSDSSTLNEQSEETENEVKNPPEVPKPSAAKRFADSVFDVFEMFAICTAVILLLFSYVARLTVVEGGSMEDTLHERDYLIVQSIGYTPHRGDIVVLQKMSSPNYHKPLIKRIIAVGGDTIDIDYDTQTVYVNGKALDEPYTNLEGIVHKIGSFPLTVDEGKVFVMGDHRNHSSDSRVAEIGQIEESCIVGRAIFRILPWNDAGILRRAVYD